MTAFALPIDQTAVRDYLELNSPGSTSKYSDATIGSNIRAAVLTLEKETHRFLADRTGWTWSRTTMLHAQVPIPGVRVFTTVTWGGVTLNIVGTAGYANVDGFAQMLSLYTEEPHAAWISWASDMDYLMIQDFARRVSQGRPPGATGEDGLRALELALGAYRSAQSGRPVKLPLPR